MRYLAVLLLVCLAMIGGAKAGGLTGSYVARSDMGAVLVQLVETSDGHVTGRFEQSLVTDKGTVETRTASLNGAADGPSAVLTLTAEQFLGESATVSVTVSGEELVLTGKGMDLRLRSGAVDDYRTALTGLALSAEIVRQSQAEDKALRELRAFSVAAKKFAAETVDRLARFAPTEAAFRDATDRMRRGLAKERGIIGGDEASVARSQLSVAISQTEVEASAAYGRVEAAKQSFASGASGLLQQSEQVASRCSNLAPLRNPDSLPEWKSACADADESLKALRSHIGSMQQAFASIEAVWLEQHGEMVELTRAAEAAEQ
ncbi:hypothetical protein LJR016_004160 [Devosia sp. LjRoot16]|uniref:hypothetical protein n=1 Tax=Devosia sp. LjRoot16 TaxID=3342271 RepID=UPI003ED158F8